MGKTIKQKFFWDCTVASCSMALNADYKKTFQDMVNIINENPPYDDLQLAQYFAFKGYFYGLYFSPKDGEKKYFDMKKYIKRNKITISFSVDQPALLTVKSKHYKDDYHSVYWDGKVVRDPSQNFQDEQSLDNYKIIDWTPIIEVEVEDAKMED